MAGGVLMPPVFSYEAIMEAQGEDFFRLVFVLSLLINGAMSLAAWIWFSIKNEELKDNLGNLLVAALVILAVGVMVFFIAQGGVVFVY